MYLPELEECWQCGGDRTIDLPVCGWCEWNQPHSSCDDSWYNTVPCPVCVGEPDDNDNYQLAELE